MQNPRLAGRYAKSLVVFAQEQNKLDEVYNDMSYLKALCSQSRDFSNLLRSPVIKADTKEKIVKEVVGSRISALSSAFIHLLIQKGREGNLPEVANAAIEQYNEIKGIHHVKLTTASPASEAIRQEVINKVKAETGLQNIELETVTDASIIGGFQLEFKGNLVDASIVRDLRDVQKQFQENVYIQNIR